MTWTFVYTSKIWLIAAALLTMLFLAGYSWRRKSMPGSLPFMVACLFAGLLAVGFLMAEITVDADIRFFWLKFANAWMLPGITAITCFILEYAWPGRWLTKRNLVLLSIMPILGMIYLTMDRFFHLVSPSFRVSQLLAEPFGPFGGILFAYSLILSLINLIVFTWLYIRSPQHRWPVFLMFIGQVVSRVLVVGEFPELDDALLSILSFSIPFVAYTIALFRFHIFDPIPLARQTTIDQLHAGMIVLNAQQRVVSLNPAAEKILNTSTSQARNRPVRELLPGCSEDLFEKPPGIEAECSLGARSYTLSISPLKDFRGLVAGYLLMLRDITMQKQAQAQILEQQRALATQDERERMARELHDSLGQVLSYASLQVQTSARLSRDGQGELAGEQLDRLDSVVREAHADLREVILNLRSTTSLQQPFFTAVKQYLEGFTSNYDIQTSLDVPAEFAYESFPPDTQLQLFRILQEALSNARKHGKAHRVQVVFARQNGQMRLSIQDDGGGFSPEQGSNDGASHYGLQFMRERASQMGGSLEVISAPGAGARIALSIPWKEG